MYIDSTAHVNIAGGKSCLLCKLWFAICTQNVEILGWVNNNNIIVDLIRIASMLVLVTPTLE